MFLRLAYMLPLLGFAVAAHSTAIPNDLDVGTKHATVHDAFVVELVPPTTTVAVNQIQAWKVRVTSPEGQPLHHARIAVDGGMPQHAHGLPTHPKVTRELEDGTYLLEGMKFSMTGWWEIKLAIEADGVADTVTFNTVLDPQASVR